MNMDNEHYTEKDRLLLQKKSLERRIAEHQDRVDLNLKDTGPKRPDFLENLKALQDLVDQRKEELAEVNRKLELLP